MEQVGQLFSETNEDNFFTGKLLVAMPHFPDPRFSHAVIFICGHDEKGAMGLIINKPLSTVSFEELLEQMSIDFKESSEIPVHYGGPIEVGRGFVLHTTDYKSDSTVIVDDGLALTATLDILRSISDKDGPSRALLALGYTGWSAGQLEKEIQDNEWITIDASTDLVFDHDMEGKWLHALASIGVDPDILSLDSGHA